MVNKKYLPKKLRKTNINSVTTIRTTLVVVDNRCKDCGGSSICEHGRLKAQCISCGGSAIFEHGRQKSSCKLCKLCKHRIKAMDCAACYIVEKNKIENSERKVGQYGSAEHTTMLKTCRELNNVVATKEHEEAAFGFHAAGIRADYYMEIFWRIIWDLAHQF